MKPTYFATPEKLRAWFEKHHATKTELLLGYYKRGTAKPSVTWPESVDEALCVGWIDGVRKSLGEESYTIRFTPRTPRCNWSAINIARVKALKEEGRMRPTGLAAFEARADERSAIYAYEQRTASELSVEHAGRFRGKPQAWAWFQAQAPWYRRTATYWVTSAKKQETRDRRLEQLIADSAAGRPIKTLDRKPKG